MSAFGARANLEEAVLPKGISRSSLLSRGVRIAPKALHFSTRPAWRRWLERNHAKRSEVLLGIYRKAPKNASFSNRDALEEALCFGWIDGWFRPIDKDRWIIRYTPRRAGSSWSRYNIARAWNLLNAGKMTSTGTAKLPPDVLDIWRKHRPSSTIEDSRGARRGEVRFSDGKDYLSKIRQPALTPLVSDLRVAQESRRPSAS